MSTFQRLTLIGMYNYDNTLFDNVTLPEGYDKQTFIDSLLLEHGEKCVQYTDVDFTKFSLGVVSRKWYNELQRIYRALTEEYNPVYNFDRFEDYEDHSGTTYGKKLTADYNEDRTLNTENKRTANLDVKTTNDTVDTTTQTVAGTTEHQVAAYNSSTYENSEKTTVNGGTSTLDRDGTIDVATTGTDTIANTGTDKLLIKGTLESASGSDKTNSSHTGHLYGNIGVTTAEQMINQELDLRRKSNLYDIAGRIFANELLIQLY